MPRARRMMRRRRVGRAVVGTAVVAGTAGVVHHHQEKRWARQDQEQQAYEQGAYDQGQAYEEEPDAPPPEQDAAPAPGEDLTAKLQQLAQLHESGALSDEEFAAAKQKLLAG